VPSGNQLVVTSLAGIYIIYLTHSLYLTLPLPIHQPFHLLHSLHRLNTNPPSSYLTAFFFTPPFNPSNGNPRPNPHQRPLRDRVRIRPTTTSSIPPPGSRSLKQEQASRWSATTTATIWSPPRPWKPRPAALPDNRTDR